MSGHSKWATIKRQKGANDVKRGQLFTKLSLSITLSVREGGGVANPDDNPRLRLAIDAARSANMPKENIERAIKRAEGKAGESLLAVLYEGFGPGGFSVIVEAFTDNKQRTVSEVKNIFDKNGGSMGSSGSVMYQFEKKGAIIVEKNGRALDDIFLIAAEHEAEDVEDAGSDVIVYTHPEDLARVRDGLLADKQSVISSELIYKPLVMMTLVDQAVLERAIAFLEKLEDQNDVQKVYANFDIPDTYISST